MPSSAVTIDHTDRLILDELTRDARQSVTALAHTAHISRAQAYERLSRLREGGVLQGFTTVVDPARAGLGTAAYLMLKMRQNAWGDLQKALENVPAVEHVALLGGQFDVIVLVRASSAQELRDIVFDVFQPLPFVEETQTHLIFEDHPYPRRLTR